MGRICLLAALVGVLAPLCGALAPQFPGAAHQVRRSGGGASSKTVLYGITPDGGSRDMAAFRATLNKQVKVQRQEEVFDGYKLCDLIVDKWGAPYDLQIRTQDFAGKPLVYLNVMWKYLGQQSFHLDERQYLEHLEAIAQLLRKWDRVDHVKDLIRDCRKRPKAYFGYAVSLPLELDPDSLVPIFPDVYEA